VDPDSLIEAVERYAPRTRARIRPAEPLAPAQETDPLALAEEAQAADRHHRRLALEALLSGRQSADLTPHMQASWEAAVQILVDGLMLGADPDEPFEFDLSEWLLVDREARVTYLHPTRLTRSDQNGSRIDVTSASQTAYPGSRHG
jgi:hypothetical protein